MERVHKVGWPMDRVHMGGPWTWVHVFVYVQIKLLTYLILSFISANRYVLCVRHTCANQEN